LAIQQTLPPPYPSPFCHRLTPSPPCAGITPASSRSSEALPLQFQSVGQRHLSVASVIKRLKTSAITQAPPSTRLVETGTASSRFPQSQVCGKFSCIQGCNGGAEPMHFLLCIRSCSLPPWMPFAAQRAARGAGSASDTVPFHQRAQDTLAVLRTMLAI
jgi:hypothetical protein